MNTLTTNIPLLLLTISLLTLWQGVSKVTGQVLLAAFSNQSFIATLAAFCFAVGVGLLLQTILLTLQHIAGGTEPEQKVDHLIFKTVFGIFFVTIFYLMQVVYFASLF